MLIGEGDTGEAWGKIKGENDVILFHFLKKLGVVSSQLSSQHLRGRGRRIFVN